MKCPTCNTVNLVMSERSGVEIDYCPTCRGVWLDRGELDKILERAGNHDALGGLPQAYLPDERSNPPPQQHRPVQQPHYPQPQAHYPSHDGRRDHRYDPNYQKKHHKKSWLGDILDFD